MDGETMARPRPCPHLPTDGAHHLTPPPGKPPAMVGARRPRGAGVHPLLRQELAMNGVRLAHRHMDGDNHLRRVTNSECTICPEAKVLRKAVPDATRPLRRRRLRRPSLFTHPKPSQ